MGRVEEWESGERAKKKEREEDGKENEPLTGTQGAETNTGGLEKVSKKASSKCMGGE